MRRETRKTYASRYWLLAALALLAVGMACLPLLPAAMPDAAYDGAPAAPALMPPEDTDTVTLNAVGDVMLSRKVAKLIELNGLGYPMAVLGGELAKADLTFCNLESPISRLGRPLPGKQITFRAPPAAVECLRQAGMDVVSLANNHAVDYDSPALLETIDLLTQVGIAAVGGGRDINQARQPVIMERKGMKIAFLAYSDLADIFFDREYRRPHRASEKLPGVAPLELDLMLEDVARTRTLADWVVVSLHWGTEYVDAPSKQQREMAYRLVEAGADLVVGHHPHWFQGLEVYQGKVIAYSLGNFVMDQNWSEETREGLVMQVDFSRDGSIRARVRPVFIYESQPQWADGERRERLLRRVMELSAKLNTPAAISGEWIEYGR